MAKPLAPLRSPQTRLAAVRDQMRRAKVDVLVVKSTDEFLNEYVPTDASARVWLTGFTGSMGDAVVTLDAGYLAVDGRYWIQAESEVDPTCFEIVRVPLGTAIGTAVVDVVQQVADAAGKKIRVGYESAKNTPLEVERLGERLGKRCKLVGLSPSPVDLARGPLDGPTRDPGLRAVDEARVGATVADKVARLAEVLTESGVHALLVQKLDDIAYLSNLRGTELPYQATFKALALLTPERLYVALTNQEVPEAIAAARSDVGFVSEAALWALIGKGTRRKKVGYDPLQNTDMARAKIEARGARAIAMASPVGPMKATKNPAELRSMKVAFAKADEVVRRAQRWLCQRVVAGDRVTEADFAEQVESLFLSSGACGLSFKVISAAGKNGAIIHYSTPSKRRRIKRGELMLLDTGAYYDEGYATDLTRTFLVDEPRAKGTERQRFLYTTVLKSAVAGMSAILPEGAKGSHLDAITRAPLWAEGLNFNHGTGHGVGVNVHEFPPRVGPNAHGEIAPGYVFSIEPGVYLPKFGGVRIENLCMVRPRPKKSGFLEVVPLTFSPLDRRLIDPKLLTKAEKHWLSAYAKVHASAGQRKLREQ